MLRALVAILAVAGPIVALASSPAGEAAADGGWTLEVAPDEVEWGGTVWLTGQTMLEGQQFEVSPEFLTERPGGGPGYMRPESRVLITPTGDGSFRVPFTLPKEAYATPDAPQPGWVRFAMRELSNGEEIAALGPRIVVVTENGGRPADSGFISGRVQDMPPAASLFAVWAPADDPGAYRFTGIAEDGAFRTDFLEDGAWFIGLYDLSGGWHAAGPDLQAVTGYARELSSEVTPAGRIFTLRDNQPLEDVEFQLAPGPAPAEGAIVVGTSEASPASPAGTSSAGSSGWLALTMLGTGGAALLVFSLASRWGRRPSATG
jgi:hypothetical protein